MRPIRFYYEHQGRAYYLDNDTNTFGNIWSNEKHNTSYSYFELFKGYEANEEGLRKYKLDFFKWSEQLKAEGIYYEKYYNHRDAVELNFKRYAKREIEKIKMDVPNIVEFSYIEKCYNAGLIYFNDEYADKSVNCYGYDFKAYYPSCLCAQSKTKKHLQFPIKQGKEHKITNLDYKNLRYGIYKIKIECDNEEFKKIFRFSKHNYYTHYSIWFCNHYKEKYNIEMVLNTDEKYNAYLYDDMDLIYTDDIFKNWFKKMNELKNKYPKNKLVKHLMTSLWGYLSRFKRQFRLEDDIINLDISDDVDDKCQYTIIGEKLIFNNGLKTLYEITESNNPYKYAYGRLKPFLLSLTRNIIGMYIERNELNKCLVRIATDGFILTKPFDVENHFILNMSPIKDESKTREIYFKNFNSFT